MPRRIVFLILTSLWPFVGQRSACADEILLQTLSRSWDQSVQPFLTKYCIDCHRGESAEAKFDLTIDNDVETVLNHFAAWEHVKSRLIKQDMPPADADPQPSKEERQVVLDWLRSLRRFGAMRGAGDPGVVATRRLSHAEYDYTIRDLTGQDLKPTREFPVDPANESGFDNSAESLTTSPALLQKYLGAARFVAEHLVLTPKGIRFAPHPVVTETDRDKYCVKRIVDFYLRQPTQLEDYFYAAHLYNLRNQEASGKSSLDAIAQERAISPKYLGTVWQVLHDKTESAGPLAKLQEMWRGFPTALTDEAEAKLQAERMSEYVRRLRESLGATFVDLEISGSNKGSQPFVLWKNDQYASYRRRYSEPSRIDATEKFPELSTPEAAELRPAFERELARFCDVFPDAFYISERGRDYVGKSKDQQEKGRLLSAGFHSMMGYYRDDQPLCDLILDEAKRDELDALWQELDFVTSAPHRQYSGFLWFERTDSRFMRDAEFDFARAEDKNSSDAGMITRLADVYVAKARRQDGSETAVAAVEQYFQRINAQIRWVEAARKEAEPIHFEAICKLAARAYRRPFSDADQEDLSSYYKSLREESGLSHEAAIQDVLVSILMSPWFSFHTEHLARDSKLHALDDLELANRLSYFIWSSMPDAELTEVAQQGKLSNEKELLKQVDRMLKDPRARALAVEFFSNWLDFRRFEEHNSVDRNRFPEFNDELRQSMFEEPIRFFMDVLQQDQPLSTFVAADHTFVNTALAKHYGIKELDFSKGSWQRADSLGASGRGGLLPMAVFLTKNAPGLRTSPVKRGYWVVRRLLGEHIPAPPPNVPDIPADEKQLGDRTLAEVLASHRAHASCAVCHDRFDSIGLVFENYGPVGEWRTEDLGGRPVDSRAEFPGGNVGNGVKGLQEYLLGERKAEFLNNFNTKLLSYALGRSLLLTDDPLLDKMAADQRDGDERMRSVIQTIVTSPQFRRKRGLANHPALTSEAIQP